MEIYADLRCLQDVRFAFRGVGYHCSTLMRAGRSFFPRSTKWIGLIDPAAEDVPAEYRDLVDEFTTSTLPDPTPAKKLFIQTSPMTHEASRYRRFLEQPNVLSAVLVYDFIPLDLPERYLASKKSVADYASCLTWLSQHELMFPISQYSANRLQDLLDPDPADVFVTGVALRPEFEAMLSGTSLAPAETSTSASEFFLFVGGEDRRKNLDVVLRAHARLTSHDFPSLVVVGSYSARSRDEIHQKYRAMGGRIDRLCLQESISDSQLASLYRDCLCSICASEIEGFSLPPVESMACGRAVIASNIDAHLELISTQKSLFAPADVDKLTELLRLASTDRAWLQQLADLQSPTAQRFLAERVAYRFWGPIARRLANQGTHSASRGTRTTRPRIALLSPFPPDRSGIADYTRRSVEAIGKLADVDIYCETEQPEASSSVCHFHPMSELPYTSGAYDRVVSVIGNSHFHTRTIEAQVKFGGPCLIHDNRLAELYNWWKGPEAFQKMASRSLGRPVSFHESQSWIRDPGKLPSLFFDDIIPSARPLLLHSRGTQAEVRRQYGVDSIHLPFCVYRQFEESDLTPESKTAARQRLGIDNGVIAIITLGIVGASKAPQPCIEAVAKLRQAGVNAHLYFVGSIGGQEKSITATAREHRIADAIHTCGEWVQESTYQDFVVAADLAIQLRTHFFGGLSGAMLDCIASGLTTVANDDLAESLESPPSVLRISDQLNADELAGQLLFAVQTLDLDQRLTAGREQYLQLHSFHTYADQFMAALGLPCADLPTQCVA